eukprot:13261846-Ditylum_brightwellii.AAC.1
MQEIAPMISLKSKVKYVLAALKYDHMIKNNVDHYKTLIREQNASLTNYADCRIGGISEVMLNVKVSGKMVRDNNLLSPFIVDMHLTVYTDSKGIWTIESTTEDLYKSLQDVKMSLKVLPSMIPEEFFSKYPAFPTPRVIPQYGNSYKYTTKITASVFHDVNNDDKSYVASPRIAWNKGLPKTIRKSN